MGSAMAAISGPLRAVTGPPRAPWSCGLVAVVLPLLLRSRGGGGGAAYYQWWCCRCCCAVRGGGGGATSYQLLFVDMYTFVKHDVSCHKHAYRLFHL